MLSAVEARQNFPLHPSTVLRRQSLGYDFRGFGLDKADFFADGVRTAGVSAVEGVMNLFTWEGATAFAKNMNSFAIPDVISAGKRAYTLAKDMSTYNDYD